MPIATAPLLYSAVVAPAWRAAIMRMRLTELSSSGSGPFVSMRSVSAPWADITLMLRV